MRIRPIMLTAATLTAAALAAAGGMATAATGTSTPTPAASGTPSAAPSAAPAATPSVTPTATPSGSAPAAAPVVPGSGSATTAVPVPSSPSAPATVTDTATTTIDAATTTLILSSCLGSGAAQFQPVVAVRTPVASPDADGVVVAVNSAGQYVQCASKGSTGTSSSVPATFINDRLWGVGHLIEFFDNFSTPTHADGRRLSVGAGHYTSEVAKVTVSYGDDPTQYPTVMGGGAYVHAAALSAGSTFSGASYIHAFNADGKEIYNQKTQPNIK
ncbi:hypothetical protein ACFCX4_30565 [Kitasatospora sp. NPDC056327]|uniref:hypothetical protein n=1 Tax=Kitasatospora sp. NPDC056327 TaxID=3345785 RepID=UPI0035E0D61B